MMQVLLMISWVTKYDDVTLYDTMVILLQWHMITKILQFVAK